MIRNRACTAVAAALTWRTMPLHEQEPNNYAWLHIAQDPLDAGITLPRQHKAALEKHLLAGLQHALPMLTVVAADAHPPANSGPAVVLTWTITTFNAGNQQVRRRSDWGSGPRGSSRRIDSWTNAPARCCWMATLTGR